MNLAYGISGILYAALLSGLRPGLEAAHPQWSTAVLKNEIFMAAMDWFPWYFLALFFIMVVFSMRRLRFVDNHRGIG
jgi:hypothetical protein